MSFLKSTEDYYRKFIELQEKLRKSEEERLRLEMRYNEMVQLTREEEETHHRKLQTQYQNFLEDDQKRQERNDRIVKVLERIENRAALLAAKTERFQLFRKQYTSYLRKMTGDVHYHPVGDNMSLHSAPSFKSYDVNTTSPTKTEIRSRPSERVGDFLENESRKLKPKHRNGDLYNHPTIRRALNGKEGNLIDDLESLKSYLNARSPMHEKPCPSILDGSSSDSSDNIEEPVQYASSSSQRKENKSENIIKWKPKFQFPRKNKFQFRRNRWNIPERRLTYNYPKRESKFSPRASPSLQRRYVEPSRNLDIPRYQDIRHDFGLKPTSSVRSEEDDFDFRQSTRYHNVDQSEKYSIYSSSPTRNYTSSDLGYQLSNYPNLDIGNRMNIEYTLYPKISDLASHRNNYPSTSFSDYQANNYRSSSPGRNRVSWYDHYLGRCPPVDKSYESYSKHPQNVTVSNKNSNDYNSSKSRQDSILLNSEIRNTKYSDYTDQPTAYHQPKKVDFVDVNQQNDYTRIKKLDSPKDIVDNVSLNSTKSYDNLSKDDADETEDQVLSEVLQDDLLETTVKCDENKPDSTPTQVTEFINGDDHYEEPVVSEDAVQSNMYEKDDYYEEKHDSLEEIQKEYVVQKPDSDNHEIDEPIRLEDAPGENIDTEVVSNNEEEYHVKPKEEITQNTEEENYLELDSKEGNEIEDKIGKVEEHKNEISEETIIDEHEDISKEQSEQSNEKNVPEEENEETELIPKELEVLDGQIEKSEGNINENIESKQESEVDESKIPTEISNGTIEQKSEDAIQHKQTTEEIQNQQYTTEYENVEYQPDAPAAVQYDENGQPVQYTEYPQENVQYDEHGQPVGYGDGQYYPQYDENGQLIQQYDENGQPIVQYDENGQPVVQYDEHGQPIVQYDENGQPLYQYDQYYQNQQFQEGQEQYVEGQAQYVADQEQYAEGQKQYVPGQDQYAEGHEQYVEGQDQQYQPSEQQYQEGTEQQFQEGEHQQYDTNNQQYQEGDNPQYQEEMKENQQGAESQYYQDPQQSEKVESEKQNVETKEKEEKKMKVLDMLDTDSESTKQDTKVSNDSDFDFSNK